jgi:transcription elongation GreA/GreB family factor
MKTLDQSRKAIAKATAKAYDTPLSADDVSEEHALRDVRSFILKTAGRPHRDLAIRDVAALALSRADRMNAEEALASTVADLIDGGVSLDRLARAPRNLDAQMARHRATRARKNPLPADLRAKARAEAPRVIRRSGESVVRRPKPVAREATASVGSRVKYRRLDDGTEHEVSIGGPPESAGSLRVIPASSPLALALRGATKGTVLSATLGGRAVELEVVDVSTR